MVITIDMCTGDVCAVRCQGAQDDPGYDEEVLHSGWNPALAELQTRLVPQQRETGAPVSPLLPPDIAEQDPERFLDDMQGL
jgi:hypothetical protein